MGWTLTVAAVIRHGNRYLVVEERDKTTLKPVLNQPAGHVDPGESAIDAVIRETWEEAGVRFTPSHIIGLYPLMAKNGKDYLRICFAGEAADIENARPQDTDIFACHLKTIAEIEAFGPRSSLVLECIADFERGLQAPLSLLRSIQNDR
ncbi:NUDIX domain-containing protein [Permianibacter aggregans]|uniref:Phosphatase NudJ n=1 Tax=Permianibacter aggregans TaxID=1510150 RepID=A0A4V3D6X2_9GAMM|nr:NUDIX domain-containing protein [Permianibacter aggregans]QGX38469.1 NUDIX domain-containing protein [Permianibacter aggregans]TDQ45587.1 phosphatase NudJ [Permianibacter aggregans]